MGILSPAAAVLVALSLCAFAVPLRAQAGSATRSPAAEPSAFAIQKAERLLREQLPCLGCHMLNGEGGTIGPDLTTVRSRRSSAYIAAMVADPQATAPGSVMPRTLMLPSTRDLIVRYLSTRPGNASDASPAPRAPVPPATDGAALFARWCAACHGTRGMGDGPNARNLPVPPAKLADADRISKRPDDSLYDTIAGGGAVMNRSPRMPAFGATLTPAEIRALVAHVRTLCSCNGPAWSRDGAPRAPGGR